MNETQVRKRKMLWRSRRGLLELDLVLRPFVEAEYERLPKEKQILFAELLEVDDVVILEWVKSPDLADLRFKNLILDMLAWKTRSLASDS